MSTRASSIRRTAILFGDGAGAAVLGPAPAGPGLLATRMLSFGAARDHIRVPAGGSRLPASRRTVADGAHYFAMNGRAVRDFVAEHLPAAVDELLRDAGVAPEEVAHVVPHQANGVLLADLHARWNLRRARLHTTVGEFGNCGAASVGLTLDVAARAGAFQRDDLVLLAGFGGGMAVGLALLRWQPSTGRLSREPGPTHENWGAV